MIPERRHVLRSVSLALAGAALGLVAMRAFAGPRDREESSVEFSPFDLLAAEADVSGDSNMAAFLSMIRKAEGTAGPNGYRMIFGGQLFSGFADHPRVRVPFTQTDGKPNVSTAAGAYQFVVRTWDDLAEKLSLPDFSPASQDRGAVELIRERGALDDVREGRFETALSRVATVWASLPGSPYPQPSRSLDFVISAYEQAGGSYA